MFSRRETVAPSYRRDKTANVWTRCIITKSVQFCSSRFLLNPASLVLQREMLLRSVECLAGEMPGLLCCWRARLNSRSCDTVVINWHSLIDGLWLLSSVCRAKGSKRHFCGSFWLWTGFTPRFVRNVAVLNLIRVPIWVQFRLLLALAFNFVWDELKNKQQKPELSFNLNLNS